MKDLTLIIPAKNEKESLPSVLEELNTYDLKIIIVLEKSDIETIESIKEYRKEIVYQTNKGYGDALIQGLSNVKTKYFCIFNADGSFNPIELETMLEKLQVENKDIVFASRYEKNCSSEDDTITTYVGNFIFSLLGKIFFKLPITDILYTYVMGKTDKILNLHINSKDFVFCDDLPIKAHRNKLNIDTSISNERKRIGGKKKVSAFKDGFLILLGMIKLFFA